MSSNGEAESICGASDLWSNVQRFSHKAGMLLAPHQEYWSLEPTAYTVCVTLCNANTKTFRVRTNTDISKAFALKSLLTAFDSESGQVVRGVGR
jgi:hypothetical protein